VSWPTAGLLLLGIAALGVLAGHAPTRWGTGLLAGVLAVPVALVFLPWACVSPVGSTPISEPAKPHSATSCDTVYGIGLPELGGLGEDGTGRLLALGGGGIAVAAVVLTRRRQDPAAPDRTSDDER
jgi:hypothetical protein